MPASKLPRDDKEVFMRYRAFCCTLLLGGIALAQQGQPPPTSQRPYETPPTFPEGRQTPRQPMPPDTQAPPPQAMSSEQVEAAISDQLRSEPALFGSYGDAKVVEYSPIRRGDVSCLADASCSRRT